jgi:hypothetical protein
MVSHLKEANTASQEPDARNIFARLDEPIRKRTPFFDPKAKNVCDFFCVIVSHQVALRQVRETQKP